MELFNTLYNEVYNSVQPDKMKIEIQQNCPHQTNCVDCGVFIDTRVDAGWINEGNLYCPV